jgi:hypothetical protein
MTAESWIAGRSGMKLPAVLQPVALMVILIWTVVLYLCSMGNQPHITVGQAAFLECAALSAGVW